MKEFSKKFGLLLRNIGGINFYSSNSFGNEFLAKFVLFFNEDQNSSMFLTQLLADRILVSFDLELFEVPFLSVYLRKNHTQLKRKNLTKYDCFVS